MIKNLIEGLLSKDIKSISKIISYIENNHPNSLEILDKIFSLSNDSYRIGITGPPGAGKSTITNLLIKHFRKLKKTVGVLVIDPTSPFSGGAVLGDRVRMNEHYNDSEVYVRSLATRGNKGGMASNVSEIADVLDAAGFDIIIFETVGVGQIEIDVVEQVDSVVLTLVPESGDDIQMLKAGIIEIADIFLINKSDRKDSDKLFVSLKNILSLSKNTDNNWRPPIIKTIATKDIGIDELIIKLFEHQKFHNSINVNMNYKKKTRYLNQINNILIDKSVKQFWTENAKNYFDNELKKPNNKRTPPNKFINIFLK